MRQWNYARRRDSEVMSALFGGKKGGSQVASVLDGPPTVRELKSHSQKYFQSWLRRREWLLRKVCRLEYIGSDRTTLKCTLSYDVDFLRFRSIVGNAQSVRGRNCPRMLLPLDIMDERPYMTNMLESCWEQQMCLATRRETARFATFLFFGFLESRYESAHINAFSNLSDSRVKEIYDSFLSSPVDDFDKNMFAALGYVDKAALEKCEATALKEMVALKEVVTWLRGSTFVLLSVPVDGTSRARIRLSFSTSSEEGGKKHGRNWRDKFGITASLSLFLPMPSWNEDDLGVHVQLIVPTGMRVANIIYESDGKNISIDYYKSVSVRWNGEAVSIDLSPSPSRPDFGVCIYMNPKHEIFTIPAFVACLVSYIVGQLVLRWIALTEEVTHFPGQAVAPVATLVPAFVASYVIVAREHEKLSFALGFRRSMLGVGAVSSIIFSVFLALGVSDGVAGTNMRLGVLTYVALQLGLLLFFLFDILRVELWCRKSPNINRWIVFFTLIEVIVWGAICTCNIMMLL